VVSSLGYINGTALTTHTSAPFNTTGASTLVAFVSTNTPWLGLPVSISGLSDNLGNNWRRIGSLSHIPRSCGAELAHHRVGPPF
jgi:hypothetical protein